MSPDSPHYQFDPDSVGWLHRKVEKEDFVTPADLARIGNTDRSAFADPIYQEQVLLALQGTLPTRPGRPPEDPMMWWKTVVADVLVEDRAAEIRAERKGVHHRGELEPRIQAAQEVALNLRMNMSPGSLLNRISGLKKKT
jgi:hypothetical protein